MGEKKRWYIPSGSALPLQLRPQHHPSRSKRI
jgi:hypothetical protein